MRNKALETLETLEALHLMLVGALTSLSLVSELQRQVLAKISPAFGGCLQSQHGHQNLAAIALCVSRLNAICQAINETTVKPVKLVKPNELKPRCHTHVGQDVAQVQSSIHECCSNSSPGSVREHQKKGGIETVPTE